MILITSFQRYGLFVKNISEEIANRLKEDDGELFSGVEFITLPVNKEAAESLRAYIKYKKPKKIICLGQYLGKELRMEVRAYFKEYNKRKSLDSDLARYITLVSGIILTDKIGRGYCNDVYYAGLSRNDNTCFLHIGRFVDEEQVYNQIKNVIKIAKEVQNE